MRLEGTTGIISMLHIPSLDYSPDSFSEVIGKKLV
jgi:hypothetical protein